ncbi:MAG: RsmF rRNA methyltransferase first C-terminal domain-containing protein [Eubacteriales bacterium]|nr:RsmF rRNA methyltransferase first C-terminal domain-containing protein [Eubacteriales bacterium]
MADLPERFLSVMQEILGDEYDSFLSEFDDRRHFGLRVNTSKITKEEFERIAPFHLTPIPWVDNGYFYEKDDNPARHPFYAAGLYYLQEPSAMTPASRLKVSPGERVLDLCAAPGGKATALAASLQGEGLMVANDINTARARALLRNMELFGIRNSFVTNEPPHVLAEKFPEFFDRIMVDAPCSGEGMFRKNPMVVEAWEEKGPEYFSALQKDIVLHAADMLKPGGTMFYSTCTFSPLENESTITWLLQERPEMEVIPMEDYEGFSQGLTSYGDMIFDPACAMTRRIWPHHMSGEGHFLALLQKKTDLFQESASSDIQEDFVTIFPEKIEFQDISDKKAAKKAKKAAKKAGKGQGKTKNKAGKNPANASREEKEILEDFLSLLKGKLAEVIDLAHVEVRGDKVYYVPMAGLESREVHFLRNGVYLGDLKKNRFEPSQPFALALSKDTFSAVLDFKEDDERLQAYMRGETLTVDDIVAEKEEQGESTKNGWYLVTVEGYPLGFGKLAGTLLKNKYPVGWRKNA